MLANQSCRGNENSTTEPSKTVAGYLSQAIRFELWNIAIRLSHRQFTYFGSIVAPCIRTLDIGTLAIIIQRFGGATRQSWLSAHRTAGMAAMRMRIQRRHIWMFDACWWRDHQARCIQVTIQCTNDFMWLLVARIVVIMIQISGIGRVYIFVVKIAETAIIEWLKIEILVNEWIINQVVNIVTVLEVWFFCEYIPW